MYNQDGQFEPTDGNDYRLMTENDLEKQVEEVENLENPVEDDGLDELVIGEQEDIA